MSMTKIAVTMDRDLLLTLDRIVRQYGFTSRSKIIQQAIVEKIEHIESNQLVKECNNLDPVFEQAMAEEGMNQEIVSWPA